MMRNIELGIDALFPLIGVKTVGPPLTASDKQLWISLAPDSKGLVVRDALYFSARSDWVTLSLDDANRVLQITILRPGRSSLRDVRQPASITAKELLASVLADVGALRILFTARTSVTVETLQGYSGERVTLGLHHTDSIDYLELSASTEHLPKGAQQARCGTGDS